MGENNSDSVQKAFAYITHGNRLLVFIHVDHPQAGIQVPAGTIHDNESPDEAVLREAYEETGLTNLRLSSLLGIQEHDQTPYGKEGMAIRHFYHLICEGDVPETWEHREEHPPEREEKPLFRLYWVDVARVPELIADHDYFLPALRIRLLTARE